jgi:hypothetical protein
MPSTTITTTVTVPAESNVYSIKSNITPGPSGMRAASAPQPAAPKLPDPPITVKYAAAVLKGQTNLLEDWAQCFTSSEATIRKDGDEWILESERFQSCTTPNQLFSVVDEMLFEIHCILALYVNATPVFSVDCVKFLTENSAGFRHLRASEEINVVSSKGIAQLKRLSGIQPLGSAVLQAMISDPPVKEALSLHGEDALTWSQVYDIIEFVGGEREIVREGFAIGKDVRRVRQTANHYRHLGNPRNYPLPQNPVSLNEGSEFSRSLLKQWIAKRLP